MRSYAGLLRTPGVAPILLAAAVSRLATAMLSLSLLLAVVGAHRSYALAGAVLLTHAAALAFAAPVAGRLADPLSSHEPKRRHLSARLPRS